MLLQLSLEKNLQSQKVGSYRAVSSHLEQLERQLQSSLPQHVMDMLGQQAAIHGSADYMAAVATVAFCGFIAALVA